ncbi:hypothetical protein KIN20_028096 [Parelaphostrongylus tenuis]|uniref:Uncharacterized protein n=1 Tax=Parelaphostrongylus tenuis TaxID=148309 RepID=A0AAD5R0B7_PARTN|nr:hypothetical protein KIN20_028096 [Parelaphostrongylus tenuis]
MSCERSVATVRSSKYENKGIALGLLLLVVTIVGAFAAVYYVYDIGDFDVKVLSTYFVPPSALTRYNHLTVLNIVICISCIVMFHVSSRINKNQSSVSNATLTSRYQTRENVITTQFAKHIATLQVIFFILYRGGGSVVREFGQQLYTDNKKLYFPLRLAIAMVPVFSFVLPIYSIYRLKCYRSLRDRNIQSIVKMKSQGVAGTLNYEEVHCQIVEIHSTALKSVIGSHHSISDV